jgi:hypothetical protein
MRPRRLAPERALNLHSGPTVQRALAKSRVLPWWPTVAASSLVLATAVTLVSRAQAPVSSALEDTLLSLDLPRAEAAVAGEHEALDRTIGARVLAPSEAAALVAPVAERAGFLLQGADRVKRYEDAGASVAIECIQLRLSGEAFAVPQLLEEIEAAGLLLAPTALEATRTGRSGVDLVLVVDAFVPRKFDVGWIAPRLGQAVSGADRAAPVLVEAADLLSLRLLAEGSPQLDGLARERFRTLARVLPEAIIHIRKHGGAVAWTPLGGVQLR